MESLQRQARVRSLPAFSLYRKPVLKETDLNEIARMVEGVLPQYFGGNIGTRVALSEEGLRIMADTGLMQQALINLVKNAVDAMPDGGTFALHTGRVHFQGESFSDGLNSAGGSCAFISVVDTGTGIDEKTRERVFEPFFTTKADGGKGLGLTTACHIIKEHGGSMKVESTPGQGTAIHIYVPLSEPETVNATPMPLPAQYDRTHFLLSNGAAKHVTWASSPIVFFEAWEV